MDNKFNKYVITPKDKKCLAISVRGHEGQVKDLDNLLTLDSTYAVLKNNKYRENACLFLDLGGASPGGYPVFKIKSFEGDPVIRIAYSDRLEHVQDEKFRHIGDFPRGCCKYLGVELPVMPANPGRFELYSITENSEYTFPLIQGQQRFVFISLETPNSSVEMEYFYIEYTSDMQKYIGGFDCDDVKLSKLWYISAYTAQIAAIESDMWDIVNGNLALRPLSKTNNCGLNKNFFDLADYIYEFDFKISINPDFESGVCAAIRCKDKDNGYVISLDLDGLLRIYKRIDGSSFLINDKQIGFTLKYNKKYTLKIKTVKDTFLIQLDNDIIHTFCDSTYQYGSFGFCQLPEKWALVQEVRVMDIQGEILYKNSFDKGLEDWDYTKTGFFISDGAKRDRLPWSGDLDWAGRNYYYSLGKNNFMANTLRMLANHQTPEGYIWATCYPEDKAKPSKGDWGYYESDLFSAWFVPSLADYLLFTGDYETTKEFYPAIQKNLDYLWRFIDAKGVFNQRYETSKGLWDHNLGDKGKYSYNNLLIYDAYVEGAFIAKWLGNDKDNELYLSRASKMKEGIKSTFFDKENGYFVKSVDNRDFCDMANALSTVTEILDECEMKSVADAIVKNGSRHGKILSMAIKGLYEKGFEEMAKYLLYSDNDLKERFGFKVGLDWMGIVDNDNYPHTTTECMMWPPYHSKNGEDWGDLSHPDTAVAHIISGCILGVTPMEPAFKKFEVAPHINGYKYLSGVIPAGDDIINISIENQSDYFYLNITIPENKTGVFKLQGSVENVLYINDIIKENVWSDGKFIFSLEQGEYKIAIK